MSAQIFAESIGYYKTLKTGFGDPKVAPLVRKIVERREELRVMDFGCGLPWLYSGHLARFFSELAGGKRVALVGVDAGTHPTAADYLRMQRMGANVRPTIVQGTDMVDVSGEMEVRKQSGVMKFDIITSFNYLPLGAIGPLGTGNSICVALGLSPLDQPSMVFGRLRGLLAEDGLLFAVASSDNPELFGAIGFAGFNVCAEMRNKPEDMHSWGLTYFNERILVAERGKAQAAE